MIEEGYRDWLKTMLRGLKISATPGRKMNRTAVNGFQKALVEAGRLADAVQALFRRLNVDSEEELEKIINAYRLAQRAEPEDNLEVACLTIDAHLRERPEDREQLLRRFGGVVKGEPSA